MVEPGSQRPQREVPVTLYVMWGQNWDDPWGQGGYVGHCSRRDFD